MIFFRRLPTLVVRLPSTITGTYGIGLNLLRLARRWEGEIIGYFLHWTTARFSANQIPLSPGNSRRVLCCRNLENHSGVFTCGVRTEQSAGTCGWFDRAEHARL